MNPNQVKAAWERVADEYAANRHADGEDAALVGELCEGLSEDATVLDVGCGDGQRTLSNIAPANAVGVDVARRQAELARQAAPEASVFQGDMRSLPVGADTVDAITAYHAVFHVDRDRHDAVYEEFARVLKPGGRVLMTVGSTAYEQVRSNWLQTGESMYFSSPGKSTTLTQLRAAGFDIVWERRVDDPLGSSVPFVLAELQP